MFFRWGCPFFHFLIYNINSTSSPTLMYSNLFLFNTAAFHFLVYNLNVTFSPTLTYSNLFLFVTASFHFLIYNLNMIFLLHLCIPIYSSSLLFSLLQCVMSALKFELEVLLVAWLVRVVLFTKQAIFGEVLDVSSFLFFLPFFLCSVFNFRFTLLPLLIFHDRIYQKTYFM